MNIGIVTIAAIVVNDTIPAATYASRSNFIASIVVIAALEAEVAIMQETIISRSKPSSLQITSATIGEQIIFTKAAT